jgi:tol-pal system protein YbgF
VLGTGDFRTAADLFKTFTETYSGGPLSGDAYFLLGESLSQAGETANAARAYLESFSGTPNGPRAPEALLKLGQSLGTLGQVPEACVTLREVGVRFPGSAPAAQAETALQGLGCT